MTVRRAKALNAVLAASELPLVPGELLVGAGRYGRRVPAEQVNGQDLEAARRVVGEIAERTFQSHYDHHCPDYSTLVQCGYAGLARRIVAAMERCDDDRRIFLESMLLAVDGASAYLRRWAKRLFEFSGNVASDLSDLLRRQGEMMRHLATAPPRSFHEGLQLVLTTHQMFQLDGRGAMAFGRMDQYLHPFYRRDIQQGRMSPDEALLLLEHFFAKITLDEDVQNITIGGTHPADGTDAVNELSFLILEACRRVGRPGGNLTARIHSNTPDRFLEACAAVIATGIGYPALANEAPIIRGLLEHGYPLEDARDYCCVGCIETQIQGKQAPWADGRINLPACVNLVIFRGVDSLTGVKVGPDTGEPRTFDEFYAAFVEQARFRIRRHLEQADRMQRPYFERASDFTAPLLSALTRDCIERGRDVNDGGARYPACYGFGVMGIGTTADSLAAVKTFVYDSPRFSLDRLRVMLSSDFRGFEAERRLLLERAPKFGNDCEEVDALAARVVQDIAGEFRSRRTPQGGWYFMLMAANVQNVAAGRELGATPDGRRAGEPVSDASSPSFGRDRRGPTAVLRSVSRLPYHLAVGGNVVNVKLDAASVRGAEGAKRLAALARACFDLGGQELQFNTTGAETLRDAMLHPERHANLVVRVSGFSARFTRLDKAVQRDILARTEHRLD